jgi:hypothetical protein
MAKENFLLENRADLRILCEPIEWCKFVFKRCDEGFSRQIPTFCFL